MKNVTLSQAIEQLTSIQQNPSLMSGSLYSVQDVLNILNSIAVPNSLTKTWKQDLGEAIKETIEENFDQMVDFDDIEFQLDRNEISAQSVGYDSREIRNCINHWIDCYAEDLLMLPMPEEASEEQYQCETCDKSQTEEEHNFSDICGECRESIDC